MKNYLLASLFLFSLTNSSAQTIWEIHTHPIYDYLNRLAAKGQIDLEDVILPMSKQVIYKKLTELKNKPLSKIERSELNFYLQDYAILDTANPKMINIFKKDSNNRFRVLGFKNKDFQWYLDPIIGAQINGGNISKYTMLSKGMNMWGVAGKWGYQLYYRDNGLKGNGLDSINFENPTPAAIKLFRPNPNNTSTSETRAHISYTWKNGSISFGKDFLTWGYGQSGKIILSERSPTFPYIRLDYKPLKGIHFNYFNAWLNSNIVDSIQSYGTGTGNVLGDMRVLFIPKFLASHSIHVSFIKGLTASMGESVVYSDKLDPGFFIPILLFKAYDNNRSNYNINAGSNGQIFLQLSGRNIIPKTHFYFTTFIDEIRVSKFFNRNFSRNQLAYQTAISVNDFFINYFGISIEYTKVRPFVYNNLIPAQQYSNHNFPLGDWMGNNFERLTLIARYTPIPRLKMDFRYHTIRKGDAGSIWQQYLQEPQPPFLFGTLRKRTDIIFNLQYEWKNNFYFFMKSQHTVQRVKEIKSNVNLTHIGFCYGL